MTIKTDEIQPIPDAFGGFIAHGSAIVTALEESEGTPSMCQVKFERCGRTGKVRSALFCTESRKPDIVVNEETERELSVFWIPHGCYQVNGIYCLATDSIKSFYIVRKPNEIRLFEIEKAAEALDFWGTVNFDESREIVVNQAPINQDEKLRFTNARNYAENVSFRLSMAQIYS